MNINYYKSKEFTANGHGFITVSSSSSKGNCYLTGDNANILIDLPKAWKTIKNNIGDLISEVEAVFITHKHQDHAHAPSVKRMLKENDNCNIFVNESTFDYLWEKGIKSDRIKIIEAGEVLKVGECKIMPFNVYHDVICFGFYFVYDDGFKHIHATDTTHLNGIDIKNVDLITLECNYIQGYAMQIEEKKKKKGEYLRLKASENSHLSNRKWWVFVQKSGANECHVMTLHNSAEYYDENVFQAYLKHLNNTTEHKIIIKE